MGTDSGQSARVNTTTDSDRRMVRRTTQTQGMKGCLSIVQLYLLSCYIHIYIQRSQSLYHDLLSRKPPTHLKLQGMDILKFCYGGKFINILSFPAI